MNLGPTFLWGYNLGWLHCEERPHESWLKRDGERIETNHHSNWSHCEPSLKNLKWTLNATVRVHFKLHMRLSCWQEHSRQSDHGPVGINLSCGEKIDVSIAAWACFSYINICSLNTYVRWVYRHSSGSYQHCVESTEYQALTEPVVGPYWFWFTLDYFNIFLLSLHFFWIKDYARLQGTNSWISR